MECIFKSDVSLFMQEITQLFDMRHYPPIKALLIQKHQQENETDRCVLDKKNDLLIWNALLTREIVRAGVYKGLLHQLYNQFYDAIQKAKALAELQDLELSLFESYIKEALYHTETTEQYAVNKVLQFIHISLENHLSLAKIAKGVHLSAGYISKVFRRVIGKSVMQYVKEVKVERAKNYLLERVYTLSEIADLLGFYDGSHFTKTFKDIAGITPMEYRLKQGLIK